MNTILRFLLACIFTYITAFGALAQTEFSVEQITVINLGDGRLLFRTLENEKPVKGEHRIIDGRKSEYVQAQFVDGMYDGKYESYKYNKLVEKGEYKEGRKTGTWIEYYSDGAVKSEKTYSNGKINGMVNTYYTNGKPESKKAYKDGLEHGKEQRWHWETGKMTLDANYEDGKPDGKKTQSITSNIGNYVEVSNYAKGILVGDFSQTWENGQLRVQGKYNNGQKEGVWLEYRKDGKPDKSTTYKNDKRTGEYKTFYVDGTVEKIENYLDGEREGICKEYFYDTGKMKSEYNYSNNVKEGKYKVYYEDGTLREEGRCEDGKEVYRKEYYKNGKIKEISERNSRGQWESLEKYDSDGQQK